MDKILVLDFGGQYNQLIARRVRELNVYAEIKAYRNITVQQIKDNGYKGIILTGGPNSVYAEDSPHFDPDIFNIGIPVLGICYGAQLIAYLCHGTVRSAEDSSEYGRTELHIESNTLFTDVPSDSICWMSHTDFISTLPEGFVNIAHTDKCPCAGMYDPFRNIYAVQFHPEVTHTQYGKTILKNFVVNICGCAQSWKMEDFIENSVRRYREELKGKKVLLALSGGVDSSVVAVLLNKAIGDNLTCVFVDHGLLRKNEADMVEEVFNNRFHLNMLRVNAQKRFLNRLSGVTEPERKRKIIGEEVIRVFEETASSLDKIDILAQGTIYPDVVESGKEESATIKSHHNVGGLPDNIRFERIIEPLRDLFKDEVREVGRQLGLPEDLVFRQPFPGPGLAIRIIGEVTEEKLNSLREADAIFREEITAYDHKEDTSQYFAVLTDLRSVGVMGDARTYGYTVALRCVSTDDFMTAEWTRLPYDLLERASNRIINEVSGISRVVYDITSKPPGTVEWE